MKNILPIMLFGWIGLMPAGAETRVFTNKEGKSLEAELLWVEENKAILKLGDGKQAKVPMATLSEADQDFVKKWWEENKDKIRPTDMVLTLERKESKIKRNNSKQYDQETGEISYNSSSEKYDLHFLGKLRNYAGRDLKDILVNYTIYSKTQSDQFQQGNGVIINKFAGAHEIRMLGALGNDTFETIKIPCFSESRNTYGAVRSSSERVLGITVTLSVGDKEFLTVHEPANLPDLIKVPENK